MPLGLQRVAVGFERLDVSSTTVAPCSRTTRETESAKRLEVANTSSALRSVSSRSTVRLSSSSGPPEVARSRSRVSIPRSSVYRSGKNRRSICGRSRRWAGKKPEGEDQLPGGPIEADTGAERGRQARDTREDAGEHGEAEDRQHAVGQSSAEQAVDVQELVEGNGHQETERYRHQADLRNGR